MSVLKTITNSKYISLILCNITLLLCLPLSSCSDIKSHGNLITENQIKEVYVGYSNKNQVMTALGSPSYISDQNPNIWYYISNRQKHGTSISRKIIEQKIVKISFDADNKMTNIKMINNSQNNHIKISSDLTKDAIQKPSIGKRLSTILRDKKTLSKRIKKPTKNQASR